MAGSAAAWRVCAEVVLGRLDEEMTGPAAERHVFDVEGVRADPRKPCSWGFVQDEGWLGRFAHLFVGERDHCRVLDL